MHLVRAPINPANLKLLVTPFYCRTNKEYTSVTTNSESPCNRDVDTEMVTYLDELLKEQISLQQYPNYLAGMEAANLQLSHHTQTPDT
jgi:hypothetical protein